MTEHWERWEPVKGLARKYYVEKVQETFDGFSMMLVNYATGSNKLLLDFGLSVDAYRNVNETFRHKLIVELDDQYGTEFYGDWTFFRVSNSEYIKWIDQESYGISSRAPLKHYCLILMENVFDIIASEEPKIIFL